MGKLVAYGRDRPLTTVVAMDAAYTGPTGLAVSRLDAPPDVAPRWWQGQALSHDCFRWLGDTVSELTPAGSRAVLVVESDAFGPSVARKLGIAIGAVEGLLIDINAIVPGTRRDVASVTWRKATLPAGTRGEGRAAAKRAAVGRATAMLKERYGIAVDLPVDAAEALLILEWARGQYAFGAVLAPC